VATNRGTSVLLGRQRECAALDAGLAALRTGQSQALVLRGEAGVGKTTLLNYLVARAAGCQVVSAAGVQNELELAFSGLYQVCAPMLDRVDRLPSPQAGALLTAFGMSCGEPPDRFLVSMAALGLLAECAQDRPLVCVIDDAQWLDRASVQALAFVARRLVAESVALIFSTRSSDDEGDLAGLPALVIEGLPSDEARTLLRSTLLGPVDDRVLDRLVAETRGNPLALLELPRGFTQAELSSGFALQGPRMLSDRIEESYRRRLELLDGQTRELLLAAAAEPLGDPVLLWRAAAQLGIGVAAAGPASSGGLLEMGTRVRFPHPLLRSAIYWAASAEQRRTVHRALAEATDVDGDPDRRAWHRAQAAALPDEDIAAELVRSANRAQARGGPAAAAAVLERAAELTPDPARRAERALTAATAAHQAGEPETALRLISMAAAGPQENRTLSAQVEELRAQVAFATDSGSDAAVSFLRAASQFQHLDIDRARDNYLDAMAAAMSAAGPGAHDGRAQVARAGQAGLARARQQRPSDLLLEGLTSRFTDGYSGAMPTLKAALHAFMTVDLSRAEAQRWLWLAHSTAADIWDEGTWAALPARQLKLAHDSGSIVALPVALWMGIVTHVLTGALDAAASQLAELEKVSEATRSRLAPYAPLMLAVWEGRETEAVALVEATHSELARRGEGIGAAYTGWLEALLYNALGKYELASDAAHPIGADSGEFGTATWGALVETIEAASRCGQTGLGTQALHRLTSMTQASGTNWALGLEARSRALLSTGNTADSDYQESLARLTPTRIRGELARSHLLYGEWLRRQRQGIDARHHLRTAHHMFTTIGSEAFAQRAARELKAAGGTAHKRTPVTNKELTPQEAHIVRLVREDLTNQDIAARLFISPRTVEWHLSKIFSKLGVTSRRHLQH
jgi:DNA-binding CsgD family transcriptional regulator